MRPLFALVLVTQLGCWSQDTFQSKCISSGHCAIPDDFGGGTGGGGAAGGGGGGTVSDGGELTWAEVAGELFDVPSGLDAGFTLEFADPGVVGGRWLGAALTYSGDVLCMPFSGSKVLRIAPNRQLSTIDITENGGWEGSVFLRDGGVLGLPYDMPTFLSINNTENTAFELDAGLPRADGAPGTPYFEGGVITLSQKVLLSPRGEVLPGVYDPASGVLTILDGGQPGGATQGANYGSAILLADGESAIMVPRRTQQMMQVTPTGARLVGPANIPGHSGGLLLPDGRVLLMPLETGEFVVWDGGTKAVITAGNYEGYYSAAWSTNGYAYSFQVKGPTVNTPNMAIIDRFGRVTEVGLGADSGIGLDSHYGLVAREDGVIVGCPYEGRGVVFITPNTRRTVSNRTMTSPWLNKW